MWLQAHEKEIEILKSRIISPLILTNFDHKLPIVIQADASKDRLGCCLLQNDKPIYFATRSLTENEKNYSRTEKELLAITFSTKKCHYYIYIYRKNIT